MIDALAYEPQFLDHLAPVWRALPAAVRGTFYVDPALTDRASRRGVNATPRPRPVHVTHYPKPQHDGPRALVASYGDVKEGRRFGYGPFAYLEHGAGQSYGRRSAVSSSYAGGPDREDNELFLVPNRQCADRWTAAYPQARVEVVGSPRLDDLPSRSPDGKEGVIALSFHWDAPLSISGYAGTAVGDFLPVLPHVIRHFGADRIIGHAHPKGDWPRRMQRQYDRLGIEFVADFDDVCHRADVYVCDNSSTIFEFAATGRPVVLLNAAQWSRRGSVGLRFWDAAHVGNNVWPGDDLIGAIEEALLDDADAAARREDALAYVYQPSRGGAALAAAALTAWAS